MNMQDPEVARLCDMHWVDPEVFAAYVKGLGMDDFDESLVSDCADAYNGSFHSNEEFAKNMADELGECPSETWPHYCIDWTHAAREIMYDYWEEDGYYFRSL